uniref:EF-hand domain-containing protein n=1 Tax=Haptolina brevifila TaxID=156173 RepID=A0A7S2FLW4_9EUKA|mmetsp:Transcript_13785/g.27736  ORF Transcript_13785/g.27736 Transcript_13785/m.27736 type:complete len:684 (+) Transcript_13785:1183-3234(+)
MPRRASAHAHAMGGCQAGCCRTALHASHGRRFYGPAITSATASATTSVTTSATASASIATAKDRHRSSSKVRQGHLKPFLYIRRIFREYELYCLEHDLPIEPKRDVVQRTLVNQPYNARINQLVVSRLRGLKWKSDAVNELRELHGPVSSLSARSGGAEVVPTGWVREFIRDCCDVTKQPGDWIDMKTRPAPPVGENKLGFEEVCRWYCNKRRWPMINLAKHTWIETLPIGVYFRSQIRVRQVHGLKLRDRDQDDDGKLDCCSLHRQFYVFEAIAVLLHVSLLLIMPVLALVLVAAQINHQWALTTAPFDGSATVARPILWADVVQPFFFNFLAQLGSNSVSMYPLAQILIYEAVVYACATILRMLCSYLNPPIQILQDVIFYTYAAFFVTHTTLLFAYVCMIAAWFLVAAVLDPSAYLPYAVGILVILVACRTVGIAMYDAARNLAARIQSGVRRALRLKLKRAREQMEEMAAERLRKENEADDDSFEAPLGPQSVTPTNHDKVDAADIFALLKETRDAEAEEKDAGKVGDDEIERADFRRLFSALDLDLTEGQLEGLFAVVDLSGNRKVSAQEFEGAWDLLQKEMVEAHVQKLGLSPAQIFISVSLVLVILIILLVFLLLIVSAWVGEDNFGAVVKSGLVTFVGTSITRVRSKTKAEAGEGQLDEVVNVVLGEQADEANDE